MSDFIPALGTRWQIEHDGFIGEVIGHYNTLEGKRGVVLQQLGSKVVHVYGTKWLKPYSEPEKDVGAPATVNRELRFAAEALLWFRNRGEERHANEAWDALRAALASQPEGRDQ